MDPNTPGVVIGLGSIIAVCGAVLHWVHHKWILSNDIWVFRQTAATVHGDGSVEALLITMLVMIITVVGFRWALK